jgi:hypothetical protein
VGPLHPSSPNNEAREIAVAVDAVPPALEARLYPGRIVGRERDGRPEALQGLFDLGPEGLYVSERERGGDERDDLFILEGLIPVDEFDRIGRAPRIDIALGADGVEGAADGLFALFGRP